MLLVLQFCKKKKKGLVSDESRKLSSNISIFRLNNPQCFTLSQKKIFKELRYNSSIIGMIFFQHDEVDKKSLAVYQFLIIINMTLKFNSQSHILSLRKCEVLRYIVYLILLGCKNVLKTFNHYGYGPVKTRFCFYEILFIFLKIFCDILNILLQNYIFPELKFCL